jgi:hypothetical protein
MAASMSVATTPRSARVEMEKSRSCIVHSYGRGRNSDQPASSECDEDGPAQGGMRVLETRCTRCGGHRGPGPEDMGPTVPDEPGVRGEM